jgi:N-carbamoylputrescine amidase
METKLAITQLSFVSDYATNIAKADDVVRKAAHDGAQVILLSELFEGLYFCQIEDYAKFSLAEEAADSKTIKHFQSLAKELKVVLPISFFEKAGNVYFNSIAIIDADGKVLGVYRKSHIPTGECYEEKFYFTPGDTGFMVFKTAYGRLGVGICWDQWFPEVARILTLKGAQFIVYPTAIGSEPVLPKDSKDHWQNTMKGHAAANIIPVIASNRVGIEKAGSSSMKFFGSSFIADQHGEKAAEMGRDEEGYRIVSFNLEQIDAERRDWGVFRDRRTDLYGDLIKLDASKK